MGLSYVLLLMGLFYAQSSYWSFLCTKPPGPSYVLLCPFYKRYSHILACPTKNKILQYTKDRITGLKSSLRVTEKCAYCLDFSTLPQDVAFRS